MLPRVSIRAYHGEYRYNGTGWNGPDINLKGAGFAATTILIGDPVTPTQYLIDTNQQVNSLTLQDIMFFGGLGVFHSTYTGSQNQLAFPKV